MSSDEFLVRFMLFFMEIILLSGLKPCVVISKAASCGFTSLVIVLFQKKVDKETDSAYAIRIEDWESANHQIITWFRNNLFYQLLMSLATLILPKKFRTYLLLSSTRKFKLTCKLYHIRQEPDEWITVYHSRLKSI